MRKFYLLSISVIISSVVSAQIAYNFSTSSGTYTSIAAGTSPSLSGLLGGSSLDDGAATGIPIGFSFRYNGIDYSTVGVNTNGFIFFGTLDLSSSGFTNNLTVGPGSGQRPVIAPFWDDLSLTVATNLKYQTTGTGTNKVFTMEWNSVRWPYNGNVAISFQVKLFQTSNIIEFIYRRESGTPGQAAAASIGISATTTESGNFMSVQSFTDLYAATVSTTTENRAINLKPQTGQIFRFTPLCLAPASVQATNIATTSATFNWAAAPGASYNWEVRTTGAPGSGGAVASGNTGLTNATINSLLVSTSYIFYIQSNCGFGLAAWSSFRFATLCNPTNVPYSDDFETVTPPATPTCVQIENANYDTNNWTTASEYVPGMTGNKMNNISHRTNNADDWFFTRGINLTAGTNYIFKFKYGVRYSYYPAKLEVKAGASANAAGMTSQVIFNNNNITSVNDKESIFTPPTSGIYYFGFHDYSDAYQDALYIDDVSVDVAPPGPICTTNLSPANGATNVNSPITLTWNSVANATSYDVFLSSDGSAYNNVATVSSNSTIITGGSNTTYSWYVRPRNISPATGCEASATSFTTAFSCGPLVAPQFFGQAPPSPARAWIYCKDNSIGFGVQSPSATDQTYTFSQLRTGTEIKKGGPLDGNGGQLSVAVAMLSAQDAGAYRIVTTNECGTTSPSPITFQAFYGGIDNLAITSWGSNSVAFKWAASGPPGAVTYEYAVTTLADSTSASINYLTTIDTIATAGNLTPGIPHYIHVRVKAVQWNGNTVDNTEYGTCDELPFQTLRFTPCSSAAPVGTINNTNISVCTGGTATLTATGGNSYQWYRENNTIIAGATSNTYAASTPGQYKVYVTTAAGCQGMTSSATVIQTSLQTGVFSGGGNFFAGDTVRLGISNTTVGQTYKILKDGTEVYSVEGIGQSQEAFTGVRDTVWYKFAITDPSQAGRYTVRTSNPFCGSVDFGGVDVFLVTSATICPGGTISFSVPSVGAGYTYQWQVNTGSGFTNISDAPPYSGVTTRTLTVTNPAATFNGYIYRNVATGANTVISSTRTLKFGITWTGATSTSWNTPSNWNCGIVPDSSTDVIITAGMPRYPTIFINTSCKSVDVKPGATLTVLSGRVLTLTGQ